MELISRKEVLKCIDETIITKGGEENSKDILARVFQGIKNGLVEKIEGIPTIETRTKGEWIVSKEDSNFNCSICGCNPRKDFRASSLEWIREINGCDMQYCPWCGADMGDEE